MEQELLKKDYETHYNHINKETELLHALQDRIIELQKRLLKSVCGLEVKIKLGEHLERMKAKAEHKTAVIEKQKNMDITEIRAKKRQSEKSRARRMAVKEDAEHSERVKDLQAKIRILKGQTS